jgi:hypothetical protein
MGEQYYNGSYKNKKGINLAQDRDEKRAHVSTVINL